MIIPAMSPSVAAPGRPVTRAGLVIKGLLLGALGGGLLTSGVVLVAALTQYPLGLGLQFAALALPLAIAGWMIGLVAVGGPVWWLLRRSKIRPTRLAAWIGAILAALAVTGPSVILTFGHGNLDWTVLIQVAAFAFCGAVVGWIVARVAYGQPGNAG